MEAFAFGFLELAFLGELGDAGLVGVAADVAVGDAAGHPHGTVGVFVFQLLGQVGFDGALAFADEFEDPHLVGVGDGEALALAVVGVVAHEAGEDLDGLAGVLGALEGEVDERAVVDAALNLLGQLLAAAVGGLADGQLVLVHVAHDAVGVTPPGESG